MCHKIYMCVYIYIIHVNHNGWKWTCNHKSRNGNGKTLLQPLWFTLWFIRYKLLWKKIIGENYISEKKCLKELSNNMVARSMDGLSFI